MNRTHQQLALQSLKGLFVGDSFGQMFFHPNGEYLAEKHLVPDGEWLYTDDSVMAAVIYRHLLKHGEINQDLLAKEFARECAIDGLRGYGATARRILNQILAGQDWRECSREPFGCTGSLGNGGAMRVAPLGAWFADADDKRLIKQALLSAEVTHAHPDGQAGAVAIALAAAWCVRKAQSDEEQTDLYEFVINQTPSSDTRNGIIKARNTAHEADRRTAIARLGNGLEISSRDTVPLCLWLLNRNLESSYEETLWDTVQCQGDRDTTCAIVGGMKVLLDSSIPDKWLEQCEDFEELVGKV